MTKERSAHFTASNAYSQSSLGFSFRESSYFTSSNGWLVAPFEIQIWCTITAVLFLAIIVIFFTKRLTRKWRHFIIGGRINRTPVLNLCASFLGNSIPNPFISRGRHFGVFARTLTLLWIILWFVIRNSYQGALYKHLQNQQPSSPFDTIEKVRDSNCKIVVSPGAYFNVLKDIIDYNRYAVHLCLLFLLKLNFIIFFSMCDFLNVHRCILGKDNFKENLQFFEDNKFDGVVFTTRFVQGTFNLNCSRDRRVSFTKNRLFLYNSVIYFPKKSLLVGLFNENLQRLQENGLIDFWTKNYLDLHEVSKHKEPSKVKIENISMIFKICIGFYCICFVVFILEVISVRCPRIKCVLDYFTY